ncbi:hypothetical protein IC762_27385 [Bradyrhizobium genosp. L]|uniref:hypothetical protein n=1 Tax=Bradyrhizobium genosp. L TaxID=83637 RepID=UPI0018A2F4C1|nr:hypothetical protein [Bradyrhizobium genosp. L]QPF83404.1 hypothetical protein IC762_27385 [Bradyrhizobium genosp. L]
MVRQAILVLFAAAALGMLAPDAASARGGYGGGFHGGFGRGGFYRGYGWGYGPGFYYGPGYTYGYPYYGYPAYGGCYRVRQRVHTTRGWHYRIVRVCD